MIERAGRSAGLRVNHEHQEAEVALYDPAGACSRLGTTRANIADGDLDGIEGLHFHSLCQNNSDALERAVAAFEQKFGDLIPRMKWINFGGGHHITRPDYDIGKLVDVVTAFRARWQKHVYLEPGEAIALGTGVLVASVMDMFHNGMDIAILDTSATAHMPDVLEMPYRPVIVDAGDPGTKKHTYRLGGMTCLAGDVIGDYSFDRPLQIGDKLVFLDMAHYTMVKTTTFNGVRLPSIATHDRGVITVTAASRLSAGGCSVAFCLSSAYASASCPARKPLLQPSTRNGVTGSPVMMLVSLLTRAQRGSQPPSRPMASTER